jgi:hypothetical protein
MDRQDGQDKTKGRGGSVRQWEKQGNSHAPSTLRFHCAPLSGCQGCVRGQTQLQLKNAPTGEPVSPGPLMFQASTV